jgi:hypothetical protein
MFFLKKTFLGKKKQTSLNKGVLVVPFSFSFYLFYNFSFDIKMNEKKSESDCINITLSELIGYHTLTQNKDGTTAVDLLQQPIILNKRSYMDITLDYINRANQKHAYLMQMVAQTKQYSQQMMHSYLYQQ